MLAPQTPETTKLLALQKSVTRFMGFADWLREHSEETGESADALIAPERIRDTIYRFLELDPELLKSENRLLIDQLRHVAGKKENEG